MFSSYAVLNEQLNFSQHGWSNMFYNYIMEYEIGKVLLICRGVGNKKVVDVYSWKVKSRFLTDNSNS